MLSKGLCLMILTAMGMLAYAIELLDLPICMFVDDIDALVEEERKLEIVVENLSKPCQRITLFRRPN